jgi:hypothetical protein
MVCRLRSGNVSFSGLKRQPEEVDSRKRYQKNRHERSPLGFQHHSHPDWAIVYIDGMPFCSFCLREALEMLDCNIDAEQAGMGEG